MLTSDIKKLKFFAINPEQPLSEFLETALADLCVPKVDIYERYRAIRRAAQRIHG
jgi:hypothetical protein